MDAVASGRCEDATICPVSTQYDKVIETESYISELLGQPKKKENLVDFISSSSILSLKLGRVDVRFHEPWSLKGFIVEQQARMSRMPQQIEPGVDQAAKTRVRLLRTMGYKVLSDINAVSVVMPTALVGTVLLTLRGRGVGKSELVRRVEWLSKRVTAKRGRVAHFHGAPVSVVVDRALEVLGSDLVGRVEGLAEDSYFAVDRFQLSFYRNMTIHLFISEALVCVAMYTRVKMGGSPENQRISYDALYDQVSFLSRLFRGEFIYDLEGLATNLKRTLDGLEADTVIKVTHEADGGFATVELSDEERQRGREDFDFYLFEIFPFVEAIWLGAVSLMAITPPLHHTKPIPLDLKQVQSMAQLVRTLAFPPISCPTRRLRASDHSHPPSPLTSPPVRENTLPPRRPQLLRSRQHGSHQERVRPLRGRRHPDPAPTGRPARRDDHDASACVDAGPRRHRRHHGRGPPLGLHRAHQQEPARGQESPRWRHGQCAGAEAGGSVWRRAVRAGEGWNGCEKR
jgi:hypothetical protein